MRRIWMPLALALILATALPARADDEPSAPAPAEPAPAPEPKPEPDPAVPIYSIEYLMPGEDDMPEGWKRKDRGAADDAPTEDAILAIGEDCKCALDEDNFYVEATVLRSDGEKVGVAMVDVDRSVWSFRRKLEAAALQHGWKVVELGAKGRLLVVGKGAKQDAAIQALTDHVIGRLGDLAVGRIRGRAGTEAAGREAAMQYAEAVRALAPDAGIAHAVEGLVLDLESQPKERGGKPDPAKLDAATAAWRKAFAEGVTYPTSGSVRVFCAGRLGGLLLEKKDKALLPEARRVLQLAVDHEGDARTPLQRYGNRYNLACCLARLGEVDDALTMLEGALVIAKSMPGARWYQEQLTHIREKDPDMAPLRKTERFGKLMDTYAPKTAPKKDA